MSNIIQYPSKRKKSLAAQFTVKDDSNIVEMLQKYAYLWRGNPIWLSNMPGLPDARKYPRRALEAAVSILRDAQSQHQPAVGQVAA